MEIAVDTETTGFYMFNGDKPFAITTYDEEANSKYLDIREDNIDDIKECCASTEDIKIFHNAKFDILMLNSIDIETCGEIHDTMIMAHVYNPDESNKQLKHLTNKYLKEYPLDEKVLKQYIRKNKIKDYSEIPRDILEPYARADARFTMGLYDFYKRKGILDDPTYKSEIKLLSTLIRMQSRGVLIDTTYCQRQAARCDARLSEIEKNIRDEYGEINIGSNKQLGEFLFQEEGLTCTHYSQAGNPVLDEWNLKRYEHPIIPLIIEHRQLGKIRKTYLQALQEKSDEKGVIHCDFYQVGAKTGRFSCREPNLQNIPRNGTIDIRRAFLARDSYTNYYFDYSQVELRVFAHYAKEVAMIEELNKPEGDLHAMTAQKIFGDDYTISQRDIAKRLNFGIIYGIGAKKFAETLNQAYPDKNYKYNDAKMFIGKYYSSYPAVRSFTWRVGRKILTTGYVKDVFERKYTCDKTQTYKATNYLIQGCAAGILKNAMVEVDKLLLNKKSNLLMCVHDELVIEVHESEEYLVEQIRDIMEDRETFRVPILVNIAKTKTNWSEKS